MIIINVYVSRTLRLTLLAPEIIELLLGRRQPTTPTLAKLVRPIAENWLSQVETQPI